MTRPVYERMAREAAMRAGIDPDIYARQIAQESAWNPNARNAGSGAMGLSQAMPDTARQPGYGVKPLADPYDPQQSAEFGAQYYAAMLKEFGGNKEAALAAYNWGPGNAQKWLARGGDPGRLPTETRNYVQKILGPEAFSGQRTQSDIGVKDIMSGRYSVSRGRTTTSRTSPVEDATLLAARVPPTDRRRDAVALAPEKPKNDLGPIEAFLRGDVGDGGLLSRIGAAMSASDGRHPAQLEQMALEQQTAQQQKEKANARFLEAMKVPGIDTETALQYAQTGDYQVLAGLDPAAFQQAAARGDTTPYQSAGDIVPGNDGKYYKPILDPRTGATTFQEVQGGPGGFMPTKDERAVMEADRKAADRLASGSMKADNAISTLDEIMGDANFWTTGFAGDLLSGVGGTGARDMRAKIETIQAGLSFDELQKMREMSPTGGALGAVSDRELRLLGATVQSLDQAQSPEQFRDHAMKIKAHYENWKKTVQQQNQPSTAQQPGGDADPLGIR